MACTTDDVPKYDGVIGEGSVHDIGASLYLVFQHSECGVNSVAPPCVNCLTLSQLRLKSRLAAPTSVN